MVMQSVGYSGQSSEEYPHSFAAPLLSRHDSPVVPFTGFSFSGSCEQGVITCRQIRVLQTTAAEALALSSRSNVLSLERGSRFLPPYAHSTTSAPGGGLRSPGRRSGFLGRFLPPGSSVVVRRGPPCGRGSFGPSSARPRPVHRRLGCGLGSVSRFRSPLRLVVSDLLPLFDQPLRTPGGFLSSTWVQSPASASIGGSVSGQHHGFGVSSAPECVGRCTQSEFSGLGSEWTLCQEVCRDLFRRWPVTVDLFATSLTHRLPVYFSPVVDP